MNSDQHTIIAITIAIVATRSKGIISGAAEQGEVAMGPSFLPLIIRARGQIPHEHSQKFW